VDNGKLGRHWRAAARLIFGRAREDAFAEDLSNQARDQSLDDGGDEKYKYKIGRGAAGKIVVFQFGHGVLVFGKAASRNHWG
jgi:hypothetical protein